MPLRALWTPVSTPCDDSSLARSSHGLAVHGTSACLFGGELKPRTPVDGSLTVIDLAHGQAIDVVSPDGSRPWPASRVGASLTTASDGKMYLWGGRGGKEMGTFATELGIWQFDPERREWTHLETNGDRPEPRSFHTMCAGPDNKLYLHAGCPASGRLSQLHALDLSTLEWTALPSAPEPGRGGTVLTALPASAHDSTGVRLARFGGFAGYELDGLDVYDVDKREWTQVDAQVDGAGGQGEGRRRPGPDKRSVHVMVGLEGTLEYEGKRVVAVMAMGEREGAPAELGHDGAGFFHQDAWALLSSPSSTYSWVPLEPSARSQGRPEPRGWLPAAYVGGQKVVFQGGLNEKNERLADAWTLEVVLEQDDE
ncbi:hypothetical protein JCM10212_005745 [Sporobolomyces blumeae]